MTITIRPEQAQDIAAISAITQAAFIDHPHSQQTEHLIIDALRAAGALTISLVAERDGEIIGHIAFSPVMIDGKDYRWYGLGPIAVRPDCQRQGIGLKLIAAGLEQLRQLGAQGCTLVGDADYYQRAGFKAMPQLKYPDIPAEYVLTLSFGDHLPSGTLQFHPGFDAH